MKVRIDMDIEIDLAAWWETYGISAGEAEADVRAFVTNQVAQSAAAEEGCITGVVDLLASRSVQRRNASAEHPVEAYVIDHQSPREIRQCPATLTPCPDCRAGLGEACHWSCSSNWDRPPARCEVIPDPAFGLCWLCRREALLPDASPGSARSRKREASQEEAHSALPPSR